MCALPPERVRRHLHVKAQTVQWWAKAGKAGQGRGVAWRGRAAKQVRTSTAKFLKCQKRDLFLSPVRAPLSRGVQELVQELVQDSHD